MKKIISVILVLMIMIIATGCDTYAAMEHYPWQKADKWYCEEIDYEIVFQRDKNGKLVGVSSVPLVWDGKTYDASPTYISGNIWLHVYEGENWKETLLEGNWEYRGKNMVVYDFEGSIFGDEYTELVFVPQE